MRSQMLGNRRNTTESGGLALENLLAVTLQLVKTLEPTVAVLAAVRLVHQVCFHMTLAYVFRLVVAFALQALPHLLAVDRSILHPLVNFLCTDSTI